MMLDSHAGGGEGPGEGEVNKTPGDGLHDWRDEGSKYGFFCFLLKHSKGEPLSEQQTVQTAASVILVVVVHSVPVNKV